MDSQVRFGTPSILVVDRCGQHVQAESLYSLIYTLHHASSTKIEAGATCEALTTKERSNAKLIREGITKAQFSLSNF